MHTYLTRVLRMAEKWLQAGMRGLRVCGHTLALYSRRALDLAGQYAPIVWRHVRNHVRDAWQFTLRVARICLVHAARFAHRVLFMATVLGIRIAERWRYYAPLVSSFLAEKYRYCLAHLLRFVYRGGFMVKVLGIRIAEQWRYYAPLVSSFLAEKYRHCLAHMLRFVYRSGFMANVLRIRIKELLRHYLPVIRQFVRVVSAKAWQRTIRLCRSCLHLCADFLRRAGSFVAARCRKTFLFIRHYTPIVLHYLGVRLQLAGQATVSGGRSLLYLVLRMVRAGARGATAAGALVIRSGKTFFHHVVRMVAAILRRTGTGIRHYLPIAITTTRRGWQATVQHLAAFIRWALQSATRIARVTGRVVREVLVRVAKILQAILGAVKNLLRLIARALITFFRFAGRNLSRSARYLLHTGGIIAARGGERLYQYILLTRLNKPIGILLLLWPTLWALWIAAEGTPDQSILFIFIGGVVLMRSAGCIINDLADRDFDAHVSRTRQRPLAAGKVTPHEALVVAGVLALCALLLVLQLNTLTIGLSVVAALLAIIYPFTKRYTYIPQFFLGLAFGWAVPMAFAAQTGTVPPAGWILFMVTVLWALVYDTMYAMVDRNEDIKLGIKSTAILFEDADRFIVGFIQLLVILTLLLLGHRLGLNRFYYAGLAIAALLFIYQQDLIRERNPQQCFMAFLNNNWFGAMVFGGLLLNYQYD